jgi:tartrate dehydrogenase/decarboxylase/D-malate dehydrogenase
MSKRYRVAAIPGDGIGKEVLPEGQRVLDTVARRHGFAIDWMPKAWASCDWFQVQGQIPPDNGCPGACRLAQM